MNTQKTNLSQFAAVTGASSGIGFELAKKFAENGYDLLIVAEDAGIHSAAGELRNLGVQVDVCQINLASETGVDEFYSEIQSTGRPLDAIAINAGVGVGGAGFDETSWESERNLIDLNVISTAYLAKLVIKDMANRGEGKILFTASMASIVPAPFLSIYAASKAFIYSLSESLHGEFKDKGITVTALMPGATNTNFFHRAGMDDTKAGTEGKYENEPADVAQQGFNALMKGEDHVVAASMKTKIQGTVGKILPEQMKAAQHRKLSEPGSAHK